MSFLTSIFLGLITGYLQLTTTLAEHIIAIIPTADSAVTTQDSGKTETALTDLSSAYEAIPRILLENSNYIGANAIGGVRNRVPYVTDPLDALVNIYCTHRTGDTIRAVTGTGFFISADGVILTNAHVAQFLLLDDITGSSECSIRTGNPAVATYQADLLYISPAWIIEHAALIDAAMPKGTGERDYALLYVTRGLDNQPLPGTFPALATDTELLSTRAVGTDVIVAGYPAESAFASGDISVDLVPRSAESSITELMTFGSNYADVFSITGSVLGEQGASGGPIVNASNEVIGLISTRGDDSQFGVGSLRAITLSYIDRTMIEETSVSLDDTLQGNLPLRARVFKEAVIAVLQELLRQEL